MLTWWVPGTLRCERCSSGKTGGVTGILSVRPDASDAEAKAARLQRYAELRWSPDASPSPSIGRGH
jgi:hypothetical protein